MAQETQFSVTLANKPGALAHLCQKLAATGVNLRAISVVETTEQSVVRFVAQDANRARKVLTDESLPFGESEVLVIVMPDKPGALGEVAGRLAKAKININYVYTGTSKGKGSATIVFGVSEIGRAAAILKP